jgi:hypothetical protein
LIEEIKEAVDGLIQLFPNAVNTQKEFALHQVSSIRDADDLKVLSEIAEVEDPLVYEVARNELRSCGHRYNDMVAAGSSSMHAGDVVGWGDTKQHHQHKYNKGRTLDNAIAHFGNIYYARMY